jgi:hypothetical protein
VHLPVITAVSGKWNGHGDLRPSGCVNLKVAKSREKLFWRGRGRPTMARHFVTDVRRPSL